MEQQQDLLDLSAQTRNCGGTGEHLGGWVGGGGRAGGRAYGGTLVVMMLPMILSTWDTSATVFLLMSAGSVFLVSICTWEYPGVRAFLRDVEHA